MEARVTPQRELQQSFQQRLPQEQSRQVRTLGETVAHQPGQVLTQSLVLPGEKGIDAGIFQNGEQLAGVVRLIKGRKKIAQRHSPSACRLGDVAEAVAHGVRGAATHGGET